MKKNKKFLKNMAFLNKLWKNKNYWKKLKINKEDLLKVNKEKDWEMKKEEKKDKKKQEKKEMKKINLKSKNNKL